MRLCQPRLVAAVTAVIVCTSCTPELKRPSLMPLVTPAGVRLSMVHDSAMSVAVAGTFNQWSISSHPMMRVEPSSRLWTLVVPLPPGEHLFMYVVDGAEWITPPEADDFVDDGFGSKNGVVIVRPVEN